MRKFLLSAFGVFSMALVTALACDPNVLNKLNTAESDKTTCEGKKDEALCAANDAIAAEEVAYEAYGDGSQFPLEVRTEFTNLMTQGQESFADAIEDLETGDQQYDDGVNVFLASAWAYYNDQPQQCAGAYMYAHYASQNFSAAGMNYGRAKSVGFYQAKGKFEAALACLQ